VCGEVPGHVDQGGQAPVEQPGRRRRRAARREVHRVHGQLEGPGVHQRGDRQRPDRRAREQLSVLGGLTGLEEPGDPRPRSHQRSHDLGGRRVRVGRDQDLVARVGRRGRAVPTGVGRLEQGVHDPRVRPAAQVHQHVLSGPAGQPRRTGQVGRGGVHHVEEVVPGAQHLAAQLVGIGLGEPATTGGVTTRS
jgi:hypothetical protein